MEQRRLGTTDLFVSSICLGSMLWGSRNTPQEAFEQLDYAVASGVNFIDTAEMYAVPPQQETYGRSEEIIGDWLAARKNREQVIIASKVVGPSAHFPYIRDGAARLDEANITAAVDASLRRLKTDIIDLYQLHWPHRQVNSFGQLNYRHDPGEDYLDPQETLAALNKVIQAGKVRHIGLSNETPWGVMRFLSSAPPRIVSIQNPYNLLNRSFEVGLAECAIRESCGLLAYAPLAAGTLSGQYLDGSVPALSRRELHGEPGRYANPQADAATAAYVALAREHGLEPCQMALAFVLAQPFVTSAIIGASRMTQLKSDLAVAGMTLSPEVLAGIEVIRAQYPNPAA
ncbi:MAG: aldo/keto reductase [Pseudomonadota bacterium]